VANNIKLIEAHVLESLKHLNVSSNVVLEAWSNFENKYSTISIVNQSVQKAISKKEGTSELNNSARTSKWLVFAVAGLVFAVAGYFAWPYVLLWSRSTPAQNVDTVSTLPTQPIVNAPAPTLIKMDTVKRDTLITPPKENLQTVGTKQNIVPITNSDMNNTVPTINRPKREVKKEETPKTENTEVKKTEGEFDFFDKPATDSLRLN
jgi:hypothetical protein